MYSLIRRVAPFRVRAKVYSLITQFRKFQSMSFGRFVWVDLEMTGLDIDKCHIIEMACIITDPELNIIAQAPNLVINQPDEILDQMDEWCTEHHGKSGLTAAVRASNISIQSAEDTMLEFIKKHTDPKRSMLAGNSVHEDKRFLLKYMPKFMDHLHYRIIDVSTVKELCKNWKPNLYKEAPRKSSNHRALDDILESIEELKYYKKSVFS